jgi:hypothetical protein
VGDGTRDEGLDGGSAHVTISVIRAVCVLSSEAGSGGVLRAPGFLCLK